MEPGNSLLAQSLRELITPVVILLPTPAVEDSCRKNNLSFLDMLRPFSTIQDIDVPVRTASDQPYRLQEFRLRLFYAADVCQPSAEIAEEYLLKVVNNSSDEAFAEFPGNPNDLEVVQQMIQSESLSSWFQRYSKTFIQSLAFSEHEAIDHPVACIRAVSSRDENPINKFVDLFSNDQMPAPLTDGAIDPKLLKLYLLVHDNQDGPADRANEILSEMRGTFGFNECWLLCINSGNPEENTVEDKFWRSYLSQYTIFNTAKDVNNPLPQAKLGCFLDDNDLNEIQEIMAQLSCKLILPYMEEKVRSLNQQVVATRKGLKNQLKNLWWRKGKEETVESASNSMYTFSSIESQIRVLADHAFMLHDYELALSNYRLLSSDYKTDKAWKHYAGVQEMIGLSLFMLDQSRKEAELSMESAYSTYQKLGAPGQRYSTRCVLWWTEMLKIRGQYKEAATVLSRASSEEPHLRSGIFLEQAAYCYLRARPMMLRKYGFHLVLAGNRYNVCGQKKHALRTYMSVVSIFEGQGWNYISDHVHFHLGRLSIFLGDSDTAVQHFMKLLACSHQSANNQSAFLREFLHVVQSSNQDRQQMLTLDLPTINVEGVRVHFEDHRIYASSAAAAVPEDMWSPIEAGMVPSTPLTLTTWLDTALTKHSVPDELDDFNRCIAGEDLRVDVEFVNPLQIPLNLSAVSLMCEFIMENLKGEDGTFKGDEGLQDLMKTETSLSNVEGKWLTRGAGNQHQVRIAEESFTLKAGEKVVAQLKVVPYEKGVLYITGVKWTISGVVTGYRRFTVDGSKKMRAKGGSRNRHIIPPNQCLNFHVLGHMPRLDVSLHGMPEKVNSGELHRVVLELSNTSDAQIKSLKFHSNQPSILLVGDLEDLDAEFPSCLEAPTSVNQQGKRIHSAEDVSVSSVYTFPQTVVLEGKSTLLWPLWLHAREACTLLLNNILYYESDKEMTGLQYRTVRMSHTLQVFPSLQISVHISPCLLKLERYLLRLDITNKHSSESFWLRQVSCMGKNWQIAPLLPPVLDCNASGEKIMEFSHNDAAFLSASVCPSQLLPSGQSLSLFFQLLDVNSEQKRQKGGVCLQEFISDVRLGPPSSSEPLIDVATGPLFRFHTHERALKEKEASRLLVADSSKNSESEIDVILISEQQDESAGKLAALRDSQRLATHHICCCSVKQPFPIVWIMEGPRTVTHDFSNDPSCNVFFYLTIKNFSSQSAFVKVEMAFGDSSSEMNTSAVISKPAQVSQTGWYDISLEAAANVVTESSALSDLLEGKDSHKDEVSFPENVSPGVPFMWCSLSSFQIEELTGESAETYPLHIAVFSPGIYDLSGYQVNWKLLPEPHDMFGSTRQVATTSSATLMTRSSSFVDSQPDQFQTNRTESHGVEAISGSGCGHPFFLLVEGKKI